MKWNWKKLSWNDSKTIGSRIIFTNNHWGQFRLLLSLQIKSPWNRFSERTTRFLNWVETLTLIDTFSFNICDQLKNQNQIDGCTELTLVTGQYRLHFVIVALYLHLNDQLGWKYSAVSSKYNSRGKGITIVNFQCQYIYMYDQSRTG